MKFRLGSMIVGAGAALALLGWRLGGKHEKYQWGPADAAGLSVGLALPSTKVQPSETIRWQVAFRNNSDEERHLVIAKDTDARERWRLALEPPDGSAAREFDLPRQGPMTTSNLSRTIKVPPHGVAEVEAAEAVPNPALTPGKYSVKAVYGGEEFSFRFETGTLELTVQP